MTTETVSPVDILTAPEIGAPLAGPTRRAWRVLLRALFGERLDPEELEIFQRHTGRTTAPDRPLKEAWLIVGRRGGKSLFAAALAIWRAVFVRYRLAPGELAVVIVLAVDRKQAGVVFGYIRGMLDASPMLSRLVVNTTKESIELSNGVVIEVVTSSYKSVRGRTVVTAICDELAFWPNDDSADPDVEVLNAIRPSMATVPGALLLVMSSPYSRRGELFRAFEQHYGRDGDPVLVWKADTRSMNPTVPEEVIADAYAADPARAAAEWGAEFRTDVETFIAREAIQAVTVTGRRELPPVVGERYVGFADPSGGSSDAFTLAIAHREGDRAVLDLIRARRPPFDPESVVADYAATLKRYAVRTVTADRYAGAWVPSSFRRHGIRCTQSARPKSEIYGDFLPLVNSGLLELLDEPHLLGQLAALERRTARGGRDSIDHRPGQHDDVINAAAGALVAAVAAQARPRVTVVGEPDDDERTWQTELRAASRRKWGL